MGPPVRNRTWRCPFHSPDSNPSFVIRPPKRRPNGTWYPIKYRCFSCDEWGDEWDLLLHFYPQERNQQLIKRLVAMRRQYKQLTGRDATENGSVISPGDKGASESAMNFCLAELRAVLRERRLNWRREQAALYVLVYASHIAEQNNVSLEELTRYCASELIQSGDLKRQERNHASTTSSSERI
jgi:hypothetical protein